MRDNTGVFPNNVDDFGFWWTSTQGGSDATNIRYLNYANGILTRSINFYPAALSVRLVKDSVTPFDYDLTNLCPNYNILLDNVRGGVSPYQIGQTYFTSQSAAMANTSWFTVSYVQYGLPLINGITYWFVVKDSTGTILTKSILLTC